MKFEDLSPRQLETLSYEVRKTGEPFQTLRLPLTNIQNWRLRNLGYVITETGHLLRVDQHGQFRECWDGIPCRHYCVGLAEKRCQAFPLTKELWEYPFNIGVKRMKPQEFVDALNIGYLPTEKISGIHGRILRGTEESHFVRLADDPKRLVVFLTDSDGLASLVGKSTYDRLITIGYDKEYIQRLHDKGTYYKLVVFPENQSFASDWDGILHLCTKVYSQTKAYCDQYSDALKTWNFDEYKKRTGMDFKNAENNPNHAQYMSIEQWDKSLKSIFDLRALLYHCFHARDLFKGDGYTYDNQGNRGIREYLLPNCNVADIQGAVVCDLGKAM